MDSQSQDSSQATQPEMPEEEQTKQTRNLLAQLIPLHPTADYVDIASVPFTFGRLKTSNFVIQDKRISGTHCVFSKRGDGHIYIEDVSTNGTYVNQRLLGKGNTMKLKTGDIVAFVEKDGYGTFSYVFYDACAPQANSDKVLKEYVVDCVLGHGNFGVVQRVKKIATGEFFAMKVIDKMKIVTNYNTKGSEETQLMEVRVLKILRHPNIIAVEEVYDTPRYVYLILELADQGELFEKIYNQGCYPERDGKLVFRQILDAIAYLHDNNIAHRDLKPENILLHNNNGKSVVKVSDFGLAKYLGEFQSTKTLCGTPMYVAPEMLAHSRFLQGDKTVSPEAKHGYGKEVDAWSLGCILYIILSGRPPFNDPIPKDLFERISVGDFELKEEPWDRISEDAKDLISRMLVVDPAKRITVRSALEHRWFSELSNLPVHSNSKLDSEPDNIKHKLSDKDEPEKHKLDKQPSFRNQLASKDAADIKEERKGRDSRSTRQDSILNAADKLNKGEDISNGSTREREPSYKERESMKREAAATKDSQRQSFSESRRDGDKHSDKRREERHKEAKDEPLVKTMSRSYKTALMEGKSSSGTPKDENSKTGDKAHKPRPNEIEPMSKHSKSTQESKGSTPVFALPSTPSNKPSPHKSPRKQQSFVRSVNTRKLEFATPDKLPKAPDSSKDDASTTSQQDSPVVGYIEKPSQEKKRFSLSQSRKLTFEKPTPRLKNNVSSLNKGSSKEDDRKRKSTTSNSDQDSIVLLDDEDDNSRTHKKHRDK